MSVDSVLFNVEKGVAKITLNEPTQLNPLSSSIIDGLEKALKQVEEDPLIRSVMITGNGKGFCVGGNIKEFPMNKNASEVKDWMKTATNLAVRLNQLEKPVIAAVNGFAMGAGFSLALAADFILASENARFGMVFNKIGAVPDMGAHYYLPRIIGLQRAKYLMFSAKTINAQEAKDYGIVLEVISENDLANKATDLANEMADCALPALRLSKSILNRSLDMTIEQVLYQEGMAQGIAFSTEENREGVAAFIEKRQPQFRPIHM
ncbi:enoyl-CoA hydratase/isomerase family protein [Bacillus massilinigeriensis]|uniref:enoyl-CoA hydratase/isomerase family protein n=1 Tax=Bacillus massilionigeriensis TaxID=1805475 RepID=UPI00096B1F0F|nr:enoyl-CoA hydratase/isomerase family protein [Bacillus massilionigeriensis]